MMPLAPTEDIKCPWCSVIFNKGRIQTCDNSKESHIEKGGMCIFLNEKETHVTQVWLNSDEENLFFRYDRNRLEYARGRSDDTMIFRKIGLPFEINFSTFKTPKLVADFFRMIKIFI